MVKFLLRVSDSSDRDPVGTEVAGTEVEASRPPRLAIIDSGVHASHPHVQGVAGGVGIDDRGGLHGDYVDRLGHGTAVAAVIREKAPDAELLVVKVFDCELAATGEALVAALRWARGQGVDLVNLSLGTTNADHEAALAAEVDACGRAGVTIVSAAPQPGRRWLPGALGGVLPVHLEMTLPRDVCEVQADAEGQLRLSACGYPRPIPGVPPERNLKGVSFAVANATGLLARAWPAWPEALLRHRDKWLSATGR